MLVTPAAIRPTPTLATRTLPRFPRPPAGVHLDEHVTGTMDDLKRVITLAGVDVATERAWVVARGVVVHQRMIASAGSKAPAGRSPLPQNDN